MMLVMKREEKNTNLSETGRDTKETDCPEAQITLNSTEKLRGAMIGRRMEADRGMQAATQAKS